MSETSIINTANQLAAIENDGNRYELINGELNMMSPAGGKHGRIAQRINKLLAIHVDENKLGISFAAETGFLISKSPDTVRAPAGAFVNQQGWEQLENTDGFLALAPDLAIEVVSPNDSSSYVESKAQMWLDAGTMAVVVVDPDNSSVRVYRNKSEIMVYRGGDKVDLSDVVDGWSFDVSELF